MKTLTDTQKKWFLTGTLASLLSLNLVMSLAGHGVQGSTADFASTSATVKEIATADGVRPVALIPDGEENKTRAVVYPVGAETPSVEAAVTEQGTCKECNTYLINRKLVPTNVNQILSAVIKASAAPAPAAEPEAPIEAVSTAAPRTRTATRAAAPAAPADTSPSLGLEDGRGETAPARSKARACDLVYGGCGKDEGGSESGSTMPSITEKCDQDGRYTEDRIYLCYGQVMTRLLGTGAEATYKKSEVIEAWEQVKPDLVGALKQVGGTANVQAKALIKTMLAGVSAKKYKYLREEIVLAATQAVADLYKDAQTVAKAAKANPSQTAALQPQFNDRFSRASALRVEMNNFLGSSVVAGRDDDMLNKGFVTPTEKIAEKIFSPNRTSYVIPSINRQTVYDSDFTTATSSNSVPSLTGSGSSTGAVQRAQSLPAGVTTRSNGLTEAKVANDNTPRITGNGGGANPPATIRAKGAAPGGAAPGMNGFNTVNGINGANNVNMNRLQAPGGRGTLGTRGVQNPGVPNMMAPQ